MHNPNDIGNLHIVDYYLHHAIVLQKPIYLARRSRATVVFEPDFDIETERREGWAYDHVQR